jgi:hypothetical protein
MNTQHIITARHGLASGVVVESSVLPASCPRGSGFKCLPQASYSEANTRVLTQVALLITHAPHRGSGVQSPASHRGNPDSIPSQTLWDLWCTKWHWDRFFSQELCFVLSASFRHCSTLTRQSPTLCDLQQLTPKVSHYSLIIAIKRFGVGCWERRLTNNK